jgi:hypothetical protein
MIYVASSWRNEFQPAVVKSLREAGAKEVYDFRNPPGKTGFSWAEIDPHWQGWGFQEFKEALKHDRAVAGFDEDMKALRKAHVCVLVLPCNRSAHLEAGYAIGAGKPTAIYIPRFEEAELMYSAAPFITNGMNCLVNWALTNEKEAMRNPPTAKAILERFLMDNGYEGLYGEDCGCTKDDLLPCESGVSQYCQPGYLRPCDCGEHSGHVGPADQGKVEGGQFP